MDGAGSVLPVKDVEAGREPDRKDSDASLDIELRNLPAVAVILEDDRSSGKEAANGVEQQEREAPPHAHFADEEARGEPSTPTSTPHVQLVIPGPRPRVPAGRQEASASSAISTGDEGLVPDAIGRETCPICIVDFEEGDDLRVLPCEGHHRFHQQCVDQWLLELSSSCPICRQGASSLLPLASSSFLFPCIHHLTLDFHALETMMSNDGHTDLEPPPPLGTSRPLSTAGARFSRYLRLARRTRRRNREGVPHGYDPTNPPMPVALETTL